MAARAIVQRVASKRPTLVDSMCRLCEAYNELAYFNTQHLRGKNGEEPCSIVVGVFCTCVLGVLSWRGVFSFQFAAIGMNFLVFTSSFHRSPFLRHLSFLLLVRLFSGLCIVTVIACISASL